MLAENKQAVEKWMNKAVLLVSFVRAWHILDYKESGVIKAPSPKPGRLFAKKQRKNAHAVAARLTSELISRLEPAGQVA